MRKGYTSTCNSNISVKSSPFFVNYNITQHAMMS